MTKAVQPSVSAVCAYVKDHLIAQFTDFFAWWGGFAYDFPYRCILGTLIVTLLCCIGLIPGIPKWIDGAEALYSLPVSQARDEGSIHKAFFNETRTRPTFIIVTGGTGEENILTWQHLEALRKLDDLIRGKTVDKKQRRIGIPRSDEYMPPRSNYQLTSSQSLYDNNSPSMDRNTMPQLSTATRNNALDSNLFTLTYNALYSDSSYPELDRDILTFEDICDRDPFGQCSVSSILEMGLFEFHKLNPDKDPILYVFDGVIYNLQKRGFAPHYLLGKAVETPCVVELPTNSLKLVFDESKLMPGSTTGFSRVNIMCITEVKAFQLVYELVDKEEYRGRNEAWEKVLLSVLEDNVQFGPFKVLKNAFRSRDDALRSSTSESSDVLFVGLTFGLIILYSSGLNFSCDLYKSKTLPALSGVFTATLGMIAGMGFMSFCGIAFVPTALVCPFLIIGVGTDDMFVIINSYSMSYMVESPKERCILSLRDTGLAITMTTMTSLLSFFIGLNTDYLSIKNFCYFCSGGMFFGYVFVLTFFFPFHCLDAQREFERKLNIFGKRKKETVLAPYRELSGRSSEALMEISTFTLGALMVRHAEHNAIRNYAKYLRESDTKRNLDTGETSCNVESLKSLPEVEDNTTQTTQDSSDIEAAYKLTQGCKEKIECVETESCSQESFNNNISCDSSIKQQLSRMHLNEQESERRGTIISWLFNPFNSASKMSDYLLTTIAIEAHHLGVSRNIERNPSNGILAHWYDSKEISTEEKQDIHSAINKRIIMSFADRQNVHLYYRSLRNNELKVFIDEPRGTVGRRWRQFLIRYYGPIILFPPMKVLILVCFTLFCLVSLYGCLNLETGLELKDLASVGSYLNDFDITQAEYFEKYDFPVDIFFPNFTEWWRVESHAALLELHNEILETGVAKFLANPMLHMLADKDLRPFLQSGNQEEFQKTLHAALMMEKGKYKQFEQNFVWEGSTLRAWKFQMLPGFMQHSSDRAQWMTKIRQICRTQAEKSFPLQVMGWNYMMLYYESDLEINSSVTSNMVVAAFTMFIISIFGMPKMIAAFLVILVMVMIDIGIIGFMFFWNIRMNMVSMICLLIAIGFSVDFSAHVCHTFMETEGQTRNQRVLETLVLMGNPVFHGAASSILGVLMLGFSESYIFRIFFKMMTLVMTFALFHSVIFLPVVLSVLGNSKPQSIGSKEGGLSPPKSSPPDEVYFHRKRMSDKILDDKSNEKNYDLWNNNSIENGRQNRQIMPYHFRGDQWCGDSFSLKKSLSSSKHRVNNTSVRVFSKEPLVTRNKRIKKTRLYENKPKSLQSTNGHLSYSEDGYAKLGHISSELDMMQHTLRLHGISCWKQCREEPLNQGIPSRVMLLPLKEDVIKRKNGSYQTHTNSSMHSSDAIISASRSTDYSFYKDLSKRCNTNSDAQSFSLKLRGHPCKAQHPSFSVKGYQYMTIPCHERPFTSFSPQAKTNGAEKAVLFHVAQPSCHENARYNSYPSGSINLKHVTDASLRHGNRFDSTSWLTNFSDTNSSPYCTIQFWTAQKVDASNRQVLHSICWSKLHSTSVNDYSSSKFSMHSKYFQQDQSPTIGSGRTKAFSCGLHV